MGVCYEKENIVYRHRRRRPSGRHDRPSAAQAQAAVRGFLRLGETPPVAGVPYVYGDVRDADSLRPLFADVMEERVVVIHTAGIVGIARTHLTL